MLRRTVLTAPLSLVPPRTRKIEHTLRSPSPLPTAQLRIITLVLSLVAWLDIRTQLLGTIPRCLPDQLVAPTATGMEDRRVTRQPMALTSTSTTSLKSILRRHVLPQGGVRQWEPVDLNLAASPRQAAYAVVLMDLRLRPLPLRRLMGRADHPCHATLGAMHQIMERTLGFLEPVCGISTAQRSSSRHMTKRNHVQTVPTLMAMVRCQCDRAARVSRQPTYRTRTCRRLRCQHPYHGDTDQARTSAAAGQASRRVTVRITHHTVTAPLSLRSDPATRR